MTALMLLSRSPHHLQSIGQRLESVGNIRLALAVAVLAFFVGVVGRVTVVMGDSLGTFLTSQALLEHGTVKLDPYLVNGQGPYNGAYQFVRKNGHVYYYFPVGTPIVVMPAVAVARLLGQDFQDAAVHQLWDKLTAAMTVAVAAAVIYAMAAQFFRPLPSLAWTALLTLGGPIASTMGTSLWNINVALVLNMTVCLLLLRERTTGKPLHSWLLGGLLGLAYICRPTVSLFVAAVFAYLLVARRAYLARALASFGIALALLMAFSWHEYGQWLPDYYMPERIGSYPLTMWATALYGNLLSPARGLFVYMPFLIVTAVCAIPVWKRLAREPLFILALGWLIAHWLAVSHFWHWWGGWSYGPRLLTDAYPAVVLIVLYVAASLARYASRQTWAIAAVAWSITGLAAIGIHFVQGLNNPATAQWNDRPSIDQAAEYLFDWRFPQFLATTSMLECKRWDFEMRSTPTLDVGQVITAGNPALLFEGWSDLQLTADGQPLRWMHGATQRVVFKLRDEGAQINREPTTLTLAVNLSGPQRVAVAINGRSLGSMAGLGKTNAEFGVPAGALFTDRPNAIEFAVLDERGPATGASGDGAASTDRLSLASFALR